MTDFSINDLPATINTVEKLTVWGTTILNDLYPELTIIEAPGQAVRNAQAAPIQITATNPSSWAYVARVTIPLSGTWRRADRIWLPVQNLGTSPIPSEYKA